MSLADFSSFIQTILNQIIDDNGFSDYTLELKKGSQTGDGFLSELTCITIADNASYKKLDLVCKIAPQNANRRKEFMSNLVFDREATFYTKVMPAFAKFQNEKNVPKADQFKSYPKCYAAIADEEKEDYVIIMEDLRPKGFKMWNKAKAVPIENMRLAMTELGKFHGLSIAMKDQKPEEFAKFKQLKDVSEVFFQSQNMQGMFDASFDRAINALKKEEHKEIMRELKKNTYPYFKSILNEEVSDQFGVLTHGDFWNNNILYRFNEDDIAEDVQILDWQVVRYISPANDLLYNIFTSTDKKLRDQEYDNLIELYHQSLSNMVKSLGSNPDELFTLENLKDELKRCGNLALLLAPMLLSVSLADSSEISNLDEICDKIAEGEIKHELITGLNETAQLEYDRRLNDVIEDLVKLDYFQKIN